MPRTRGRGRAIVMTSWAPLAHTERRRTDRSRAPEVALAMRSLELLACQPAAERRQRNQVDLRLRPPKAFRLFLVGVTNNHRIAIRGNIELVSFRMDDFVGELAN